MFKKFLNFNKGMTYVELIVVLSIMGILSAVVIFNGGKFQKRIATRNLADEIALKIVEAQKSALAGKLPTEWHFEQTENNPLWKPAYGVFLNKTEPHSFIYFTDLLNNETCDDLKKNDNNCGGKLGDPIERFDLDNNYSIGDLTISDTPVNRLSLLFTRPNSNAVIKSENTSSNGGYGSIKVQSSDPDIYNIIKVYSSGRIEIN